MRPDILVLNAGAVPAEGPIDQLSWEAFTRPWDTDVKGGFHWLQAALTLPLASGSRVLVGSSGAARQGSPQSGGYAGAKRMLWLMASYAQQVSDQKGLGLGVQALAAAADGGRRRGGRGGRPRLRPRPGRAARGDPGRLSVHDARAYGEHVARILTDPQYDRAAALGVRGDTGITILEEKAAA